MQRSITAFVLINILTFAAADTGLPGVKEMKNGDAKEDIKNLQGAWTATTVEKAGMKIERVRIQVTFNDATFKLFEDGKLAASANFALELAGQSRLIDLNFSEGPVQGMKFEGIYDLHDDVLRICFALKERERPTEFAAAPDSQSVLLVLKRDRP